eukprot:TRINITY_DN9264_c0_g1_i1.p1 TRINITY_DN9264_c0_g1~~TRINITY_DN9264_c0_g1_i1.p1  ORF type:complete len:471 (+),score=124.24 TRINITY_DN9264_c0_g1_i1:68-1414(+)
MGPPPALQPVGEQQGAHNVCQLSGRPLFTSYAALRRAKRTHRTDIASAAQPPPPASPLRFRTHPCQKPTTKPPELREWKFHAQAFVDPLEQAQPDQFYSSCRSLAHAKCLHVRTIGSPASPSEGARDPQGFRHKSQRELAREVRSNSTPLFPVSAAPSPAPQRPPPPPPAAQTGQQQQLSSGENEPPRTSHQQLQEGKRKHIRIGTGPRPRIGTGAARSQSVPVADIPAAGSPTNAYYSRMERARLLRSTAPPAVEVGSPALPPRSGGSELAAGWSGSRRRARSASPSGRPAAGVARRDEGGVCITAAQGSNYPPAPDPVSPYARDPRTFQHHSQARLRDEKAVTCTPLHPLPAAPAPPPDPEVPMGSQIGFAGEKSRHRRAHAPSPAASPAQSPAPSPRRGASPRAERAEPPPYVGIRWRQGCPAAGGPPNLSAQRCVRSASPQTTA